MVLGVSAFRANYWLSSLLSQSFFLTESQHGSIQWCMWFVVLFCVRGERLYCLFVYKELSNLGTSREYTFICLFIYSHLFFVVLLLKKLTNIFVPRYFINSLKSERFSSRRSDRKKRRAAVFNNRNRASYEGLTPGSF